MLGKTPRKFVTMVFEDRPTPSKKARTRKGPSTPSAVVGEKKSTGGKPRLSCAECRRLKLKCDRVFPCQTCCKRGVADICPQGSLASGQGSRFILANTEQLHAKILQMRTRIQTLEDALRAMQSTFSSGPHPLLDEHLLLIKSSAELYHIPGSQTGARTSPLSSLECGSEIHENETLGFTTNVIVEGMNKEKSHASDEHSPSPIDSSKGPKFLPHSLEVPEELLQLSRSFPEAWSINAQIRGRIRDLLPPRPEAESLCIQARINALSQCNPDPNETFLPNLLHHVYTTPLETLCSRRLGVFLMVLAIGAVMDLDSPYESPTSEAYYHLARASMCEIPLVEEPNFDLLNGLFLMVLYLVIVSSDNKSLRYAWTLMGTTAKLAKSIGFHQDGARLGRKVIPEELDKRRALLWGLINLDTRLSLALCRPPSLSPLHVHCKLPSYVADEPHANAVLYYEWRFSFLLQCLSPILDMSVSEVLPNYATIIELDKVVRDFPLPDILNDSKCPGPRTTRSLVMHRAVVSTSREIALLQLHRGYFTKVLYGSQGSSVLDEYAPSVLATFSSACRLIASLESFYSQEPLLCSRFIRFWSNAASATVALWLIISRTPCHFLLSRALQAMRRICRLFQKASDVPFAYKAMPHLAKLAEKTEKIYRQRLTDMDENYVNGARFQRAPSTRSPVVPNNLTSFGDLHPALLMNLERTLVAGDDTMPIGDDLPAGVEAPDARNSEAIRGDLRDLSSAKDIFSETNPCHDTPTFDFNALTSDLGESGLIAWF